MAALVASHRNSLIAAYYQKLRPAGKTRKQALIACMRKLIVIVTAILRDRDHGKPLDFQDSSPRLSRDNLLRCSPRSMQI
jgi:hypothetical protein